MRPPDTKPIVFVGAQRAQRSHHGLWLVRCRDAGGSRTVPCVQRFGEDARDRNPLPFRPESVLIGTLGTRHWRSVDDSAIVLDLDSEVL